MTMIAQGSPLNFIPIDPPPNIYKDTTTNHMVAAFNDSTDEIVDWVFTVADGWTTGTQTLNIRWRAASATTGNVIWSAQVEALTADDATDTDSASSFASAQTVTDAAPATAGIQTVAQITFSAAQADGMVALDNLRVRISRDANNASDTMTGDAEILAVWWDDAG